MSTKEYLISREQVVLFENGKLIVDNSVKKVSLRTKEKKRMPSAEPVMMREES